MNLSTFFTMDTNFTNFRVKYNTSQICNKKLDESTASYLLNNKL